MTLGLPTFVGDSVAAMMEAARASIGAFISFPFFQNLLRISGFTEELRRPKTVLERPHSVTGSSI